MKVLAGLKPEKVFHYFEEICAIPHGSYNVTAISNYLVAFAKEHGLRYRQDKAENVIIWGDATEGYENSPTVMIQGHMDMVAEKDPDCDKDMKTDGLELFVEGDTIGARGTTLGGDDGIAVAMGLAILDSDDIPHGPLECVFTTNEEVGLTGAQALDTYDLKASYMLNLDSEAEKILTVSCAGSARVKAEFPVTREAYQGDICKVTLTGMIGGHSGEEIDKCRANANLMLGRALYCISQKTDYRLISLVGGTKSNAIPREASAVIAVENLVAAREAITNLARALANEYQTADPDTTAILEESCSDLLPMNAMTSMRIATFLYCVPNGVQNMSADVKGLVQTSVNLGQVYEQDDKVIMEFMPRSSVDSQKEETIGKIFALGQALGGKVSVITAYGAWQYRPVSHLRDTVVEAFHNVYREEPKIEALHAGLECGVISAKMPQLDCISFGPDLTDIHTPRERLYIASTERTWKLTLETLRLLK